MTGAVVFDCDGVLVDSEPISERAWERFLEGYDYVPTRSDFIASRGKPSEATFEHFARRVELPPYEEALAAVDRYKWQGYETELVAFEDAVDSVRHLALMGVPLAVASSSSRPNVERVLELTDLARYFEAIATSSDVENGKPAPDLYLAAAAGLGVDPHLCIAVEDAVPGAESAAAAGMRVVMVDRGTGTVDTRYAVTSQIDSDLLLLWLNR